MAKAQADSRFGSITSSKVKFHNGEPVFLIRGTDPLAAKTMINYARQAERDGADKGVVDEIFDHAMTIAEWQRHNSDLVKPLTESEGEGDGDSG
jgi:hypothetical protein